MREPEPPDPPRPSTEAVRRAVRRWVEEIVVGEGLCPFARPVLHRMRITVSEATALEPLLTDLGRELERLVETPSGLLPTTLVAAPRMLDDFEDYLDALEIAQALLSGAGLDGVIQLASFHPDYRFADAPADDPANATNRSPVPLFHLLREDDVQAALETYPDPEAIPERNQRRFRALGHEAIRALLAGCWVEPPPG